MVFGMVFFLFGSFFEGMQTGRVKRKGNLRLKV